MKQQIFKYLSQCSTQPNEVDRLIISAFLYLNKIEVKKNELLKSFNITNKEKEEYVALQKFISILEIDVPKFHFEELIQLFEFVISPADRIVNGAIYTPSNIREYIVKETIGRRIEINEQIKISDIACGCGGFLLDASIELKKKTNKSYADIFRNHIFGLDIQEYSVNRTKLLLSILA